MIAPALIVADGQVTPSRHRAGAAPTAKLTGGQPLARASWADDAPVTPAADWTVAGQVAAEGRRPRRGDGRAALHTRPARPGMLAAARSCARRPSAPPSPTWTPPPPRRMPGVTVVHDGGFVGVAAPDRADRARAPAPPCGPTGTCRPRRPRPTTLRLPQGAPRPRPGHTALGAARPTSKAPSPQADAAAACTLEARLHRRLHRPCAAGTPRRRGRVGGRQA